MASYLGSTSGAFCLLTLPTNALSETSSSYGRVEAVKGWSWVEGREGEGGVRERCGDCLLLKAL